MNQIRIIFLVLFVSVVTFVKGQEQALLDSAASLYSTKNYAEAANIYSSLLSQGVSAELYYNYGNACYKSGDLARAVLSYERALKLNPRYENAQFNLDFVNSQIADKIEPVDQFFLVSWVSALSHVFSSNQWAYMSIAFFILLLCCVLMFNFSPLRAMRKTGFYLGLVFLVLSVTSFVYSSHNKRRDIERADAIVLDGAVTVKSAPDQSGTELFVLHEGTKVTIKSELGEWAEIEIADGNSGWMRMKSIEQI